MLVECICGESKFAVDAKAIGFNGRLVKCGLCAREWFQESKLNILEKRVIEVKIIKTKTSPIFPLLYYVFSKYFILFSG